MVSHNFGSFSPTLKQEFGNESVVVVLIECAGSPSAYWQVKAETADLREGGTRR